MSEKSGAAGEKLSLSAPTFRQEYPTVFCEPLGRTRASDTAQRRVLDAVTRQRRQKKQLEMLEKDNSHEDPHNSLAQLSSKAKLPTFAETSDGILQYSDDHYEICIIIWLPICIWRVFLSGWPSHVIGFSPCR